MTEELCTWDAAYALDALDPGDRERYITHLGTCRRCQESVEEVTATAGILGRLPREEALALLQSPPPEEDRRAPRALGEDRRAPRALREGSARRSRLLMGASVLVAAAALVVLVVQLGPADRDPATPPPTAATSARTAESDPGGTTAAQEMSPMIETSIRGDVSIADRGWGSTISLDARYLEDGDEGVQQVYGLYVIGLDGHEEQVAMWTGTIGELAAPVGTSSMPRDRIDCVQVRMADGGPVLLEAQLPPS